MKFKKLKVGSSYCIVDPLIWSIFKGINLRVHQGYAYVKMNGKSIPLHRVIMLAPPQVCVDHINRNRLDNRLRNLRFCSRQENSANASIPRSNSSGYKGVHFHKKNRRWVSYIGKNPKVYLGSFSSAKKAAQVYNQAALKRFGIYASLNKGV
jgi:hypothetical protein